MSPGLVRTLRIRSNRKAGGLGILTTAIGDAGASIGEIETVRIGHNYTLRDFHLLLDDQDHLKHVLDNLGALADSEVVEVRDTVRAVHLGGKVRTASRVALSGIATLSAAQTPGVREIVAAIEDEPALADVFSNLSRTVAIVSDGTGLVGLGKVAPRSVVPVLEGKAMLLAEFVRLSSMRLAFDVENEDQLVDCVARLSPSYSAVMIDSIGSPRGARAAQKLAERLKVPVFHDDADGPAIVCLAAVMNAARRAHLDPATMKVGQVGLGTAGGAIARLLMSHLQRPVLGDDVHPAAISRHVSVGGIASSLDEIMSTCDVVVANTGHAGVIPASKVRERQVIIALSEPNPEIEPYDAQLAGAAFAADGRAISATTAFPGVLFGAMAVKASTISDEMRIAAAMTLAACAEGGDLVPTPLDDHVHARVAAAVARAAIAGGHAQARCEADKITPELMRAAIDDERPLPVR